jgi:predicted TIM-barrel fold metal-dependent hydrolase
MSQPWQERLSTLAEAIECPGAPMEEITADWLGSDQEAEALLVPMVRLNAWSDALLAGAVAQAANEYFIREWLSLDERLRLAILLPAQSPAVAADEIRRHGANPQVIAAVMPLINTLLGDSYYQTIYEAAQDADLTLVVHPTGAEGVYLGAPALAGGTSFSAGERSVLVYQVAQANLNSLVLQGVFHRFPRLRFLFSGFGFGWLPPLLWRMDMDWRRLRIETPWVAKLPTDYVLEHVWLTISAIEELKAGFAFESKALSQLRERTVFGSHYGLVSPKLHSELRFIRQDKRFLSGGDALFRSRLAAPR